MKKILIVEDQMLARKYLCSCIEKSTECEVASALTRADAALQRCGEGHIDLVVMDICTENDSDGLDAAEAIKKYYPRIKIIMVTSMLEGRFLDRARKIGADSFWYKDSPSGDLISVIEGTLAGKNFWPDKVPAVKKIKISAKADRKGELGLWIEKLQRKHYRARKRTDFLQKCMGTVPLRMKSAMSMFLRDLKSHSGGIR